MLKKILISLAILLTPVLAQNNEASVQGGPSIVQPWAASYNAGASYARKVTDSSQVTGTYEFTHAVNTVTTQTLQCAVCQVVTHTVVDNANTALAGYRQSFTMFTKVTPYIEARIGGSKLSSVSDLLFTTEYAGGIKFAKYKVLRGFVELSATKIDKTPMFLSTRIGMSFTR